MRFHHVDLWTGTEISGARARVEYHGSFQMRTFFGMHRMLKSRTPGLHMQRPEHSAASIQKTDCYNYYHWVHFPLAATASPAFLMMYSACKLNKHDDSIQP